MIRGDTRVHSLFGSPVAHSLSPVIFNTTFQKLSLNRTYIPFEVARDRLKQALEAARTLEFDGFNVTMPLKTVVPEMLDDLDQSARESGAVNTVARTKEGLVGHNTDGEGAIRALQFYGFAPTGKRIVMLGAGGAARALVHRFSKDNNSIKILNRTADNARKLVEIATGPGRITYEKLERQSLEKSLDWPDLIVNATSVNTGILMMRYGLPLDLLKGPKWLFDLAYDKQDGHVPVSVKTVSPLEMLLQQAALSYEIWLKNKAPLSLMRSSLLNHLGKDWK